MFVLMAERNTYCTDGEFSSIVNAALKKNFAGISSFTPQQFEAWKSLFLRSKEALIILPTKHGKSLIYHAAPDIASELATRGFSQWEGKSIVLIVTPLLAVIEMQVEELNLKNGVKAVNLGNVSDEKLKTHVRNGSYNFSLGTPEVWIKNEKWLQIIRTDAYRKKMLFIATDEAHCVPKW